MNTEGQPLTPRAQKILSYVRFVYPKHAAWQHMQWAVHDDARFPPDVSARYIYEQNSEEDWYENGTIFRPVRDRSV